MTILIPESAEDQATLDAMAVAGEIDTRHSFGDQPVKRRRLDRLRRLTRRLHARRR